MDKIPQQKDGYRGVEYLVREIKPGEWEWVYYPKVGQGVRTSRTVKGDRDAAVFACRVAIDQWLGPLNIRPN